MKLDNNLDTMIKSNRLPLCGGQDISIGIRDKVLSVMDKNRKRSLSVLDNPYASIESYDGDSQGSPVRQPFVKTRNDITLPAINIRGASEMKPAIRTTRQRDSYANSSQKHQSMHS